MQGQAPLVFLHGWASGPGIWFKQEKYFAQNPIVKVNYHQGIKRPLAGEGPSLYTTTVLEVIKEEIREEVVLIGWSLGSLVAFELALLAPEKILGMVLVGGTGRFIQAPGYTCGLPEILVKRMKQKLARNPGRILEEFYNLMFTPGEREAGFMEEFKQGNLSGLNWSEAELAGGLDFLLNRDFRGELEAIEVPSLVIHGERDEICPPSAGHYLHANLRDSRFELVPGCGHLPFLSKEEVFNKRVGGWLDELGGKRTG